MHGHDEDDRVSHNVRDLETVVVFSKIHAGTWCSGEPELPGRHASEASGENATGGPENNDKSHDIDGCLHELGREESAVEHEDG